MKKTLPTLSRVMGANDANYLSSKAIYSLNRVLQELLDELGITPPSGAPGEVRRSFGARIAQLFARSRGNRAWVVPYLFDHHKRSWHFACVLRYVWDNSADKQELFREVLWLLTKVILDNKLYQEFGDAKEHLLEGGDYAMAYTRVTNVVGKIVVHLASCTQCQSLKSTRSHSSEADAFAAFKSASAECVANCLDVAVNGQEVDSRDGNELVRDVMWVYHALRNHRGTYIPGIFYRGLRDQNRGSVLDRFEGEQQQGSLNVTGHFAAFGEPPTVSENIDQFAFPFQDDGTEKTPAMGSWPPARGINIGLALAQPFYFRNMLEEQKAHNPLFLVLLPVYDVWLGSIGYGGLWGALLCTFTDRRSQRNFIRDVLPELRPRCEALAAELAKSALATITSLPIEPPYDLVEHFVRVLTHIQDWERVSVYKRSDESLQYRYRRLPDCKDLSGDCDAAKSYMCDFTWERCKCEHDGRCDDCKKYEKSQQDLRTLSWGRRDIWSREIIPELSEEEEARFRDVTLTFDYPETAVVPVDRKKTDHTHELFEDAVIEQQIVVLRALIPKVRARRSALRNAAVSVMSRNMSHNIGSHVLVALQSGGGTLGVPPDAEYQALFSHLQARMDFIAELSTSAPSLHIPTSIKTDVVGEAPPGVNFKGTGFLGQTLLGKYISARRDEHENPVTGKVVFKGSQDPLFDCAGGLLGQQALSVIFENLIRNIAKHTKELKKTNGIVLNVKCDQDPDYPNYIQLLLWDEQETACNDSPDGTAPTGSNPVPPRHSEVQWVWKALDDEYRKTQILDEKGVLEDGHWGLKEIRICAAYLRGIPLEELESPLSAGEPRLVEVLPVTDDGATKPCGAVRAPMNIGCRIYLPVAKELAIVWNKIPPECSELAQKAMENGIGLYSRADLRRRKPVSHRLVVWMEQDKPDEHERGKLSPRWVRGNGSYKSLLDRGSFNDLINEVRQAIAQQESVGELYGLNTRDILPNVVDISGPAAKLNGFAQQLSKNLDDTLSDELLGPAQIIDYHFKICDSDTSFFPEDIGGYKRGRFLDFLRIGGAYETFPTVSSQKSLLTSWGSAFPHTVVKHEICRGLRRGVLVLDERVQERVYGPNAKHPFLPLKSVAALNQIPEIKNSEEYFSFSAMLAAANVWIPSIALVNLHDPATGQAFDEFLHKLPAEGISVKSGRKANLTRIDYVVIHQGVIDRLRRDGCTESLRYFFEIFKDKVLVVCSGRGRPEELKWVYSQRKDVRFIAVSTILEHVVNRPSKMHLVISLDASRCPL